MPRFRVYVTDRYELARACERDPCSASSYLLQEQARHPTVRPQRSGARFARGAGRAKRGARHGSTGAHTIRHDARRGSGKRQGQARRARGRALRARTLCVGRKPRQLQSDASSMTHQRPGGAIECPPGKLSRSCDNAPRIRPTVSHIAADTLSMCSTFCHALRTPPQRLHRHRQRIRW